MTRAWGTATLRSAAENGRAIAAFTTYSVEAIRAVCDAAALRDCPVILQVGSSSYAATGRQLLASAAVAAADLAPVYVGVHLDHSRDLAEVEACIELGYTSVMIDGSHLPFDDNVKLTRAAVRLARQWGVWVEGELGVVPGSEDESVRSDALSVTDAQRAAAFVEHTDVDALAVAVGNVHGFTEEPIRLDIEALRAIRDATPVPLVLHGASGVPDAVLTAAVSAGVAKVNVNAELRRAQIAAIAEFVSTGSDSVLDLQHAAIAAMREVAVMKIAALGWTELAS